MCHLCWYCCLCCLGDDVNKYEGDIDLSPDDSVDLSNDGDVDGLSLRKKRNAARDRKKLWVTRVVPYEYDSSLPGKKKESLPSLKSLPIMLFLSRHDAHVITRWVHPYHAPRLRKI